LVKTLKPIIYYRKIFFVNLKFKNGIRDPVLARRGLGKPKHKSKPKSDFYINPWGIEITFYWMNSILPWMNSILPQMGDGSPGHSPGNGGKVTNSTDYPQG
jgi:hypothetical protein